MSDDLVKRLCLYAIHMDAWGQEANHDADIVDEAADRIEQLEVANLKAALIKVDDQMRIEQLETALREITSVSKVYVANGEDMARALTALLHSHRKIALAALEGKDD